MADTSKKPEIIYPEDFYNIVHPTQPWISVQFRTYNSDKSKGIDVQPDIWTEIAQNPNNYFDSMELSDSGGAKQITLNLYDMYFTNIENIVMQSIFVTRQDSAITGAPTYLDPNKIAPNADDLKFATINKNMTNLRVRFGYGDVDPDGKKNFEKIGLEFEKRVEFNGPTIKSDWYYFMLTGMQSSFADDGLHMTLSGVSLTTTAINNFKLVQKFLKLVDTPRRIIDGFRDILAKLEVDGKKCSFSIAPWVVTKKDAAIMGSIGISSTANDSGITSEAPIEDSKEPKIEILLGSEPSVDGRGKAIEAYKSFGEILNTIVNSVPLKHIKTDGDLVAVDEDGQPQEEVEKTLPYKFMIIPDAADPSKEIIRFYYPNPIVALNSQKYIRSYSWRENGRTIVEGLSITTKTDFAAMSQKIYTKSDKGITLIDLRAETPTSPTDSTTQTANLEVNSATSKRTFVKEWDLVSEVIEEKSTGSTAANQDSAITQLKNSFVKSINQQVFTGSITLPGDPFYSFDKVMSPLQFIININMYRPSELGTPIPSYISGSYTIKEIKHSVSSSGFKTTLEVIRVPLKKERVRVDAKIPTFEKRNL